MITAAFSYMHLADAFIQSDFYKEGKPQTFIAKEAGCSQSAVSKHVNRKLSVRKKCGRKRCTINRENRSFPSGNIELRRDATGNAISDVQL